MKKLSLTLILILTLFSCEYAEESDLSKGFEDKIHQHYKSTLRNYIELEDFVKANQTIQEGNDVLLDLNSNRYKRLNEIDPFNVSLSDLPDWLINGEISQ